ncbi:MAG: hypothetical protein QW806_09815 [Nitrososphaerota archaeon]
MFEFSQIVDTSILDYCQKYKTRYCNIIEKQIDYLEKKNTIPLDTKQRCIKLFEYTDYTSKRLYNVTSISPLILALYTKESNCKWVVSKDGYGSIGYGQLTPKFLDKLLLPIVPEYKRVEKDYTYAVGYYLKYIHERQNKFKKWWITLQIYNGGIGVISHCEKANSTKWSNCLLHCNKSPNICVWKEGEKCKQYRDGCEINYEYSIKTYNYYLQYKRNIDPQITYW